MFPLAGWFAAQSVQIGLMPMLNHAGFMRAPAATKMKRLRDMIAEVTNHVWRVRAYLVFRTQQI